MDCDDDSSVNSANMSVANRSVKSQKSTTRSASKKDVRPVSKLRPKAPMVANANDTVLTVTQMLASKRGDAAIITDDYGGLVGIITDTDVTRKYRSQPCNN